MVLCTSLSTHSPEVIPSSTKYNYMQITSSSISSAKTPPRISRLHLSGCLTDISKGMSKKHLKLSTAKTEHFTSSFKYMNCFSPNSPLLSLWPSCSSKKCKPLSQFLFPLPRELIYQKVESTHLVAKTNPKSIHFFPSLTPARPYNYNSLAGQLK